MQWTFGNFCSEFHFGGGEVAATYGVRASLFLSCFFYFSDKNGKSKRETKTHARTP
jgi:hypothetical protein